MKKLILLSAWSNQNHKCKLRNVMPIQAIKISPKKQVAKIISFLRHALNNRIKQGLVIGLSGGIDSALTLRLCIEAVGKERVIAVMLPEKESSPKNRQLADDLIEQYGIDHETLDITNTLKTLNVYSMKEAIVRKYYSDFIPDMHNYKMAINIPQKNNKNFRIYHIFISNKKGESLFQKRMEYHDVLKFISISNMKLRLRMLHLYQVAEEKNYLVAGTTNKTENDLGNFCLHGDGAADIHVIKHLYKTQVYELSRYFKLPEGILNNEPGPDIFSFYVTDSEFFYANSIEQTDQLLHAYQNNIPKSEVSEQLKIPVNEVETNFWCFDLLVKHTEHMRTSVPSL